MKSSTHFALHMIRFQIDAQSIPFPCLLLHRADRLEPCEDDPIANRIIEAMPDPLLAAPPSVCCVVRLSSCSSQVQITRAVVIRSTPPR